MMAESTTRHLRVLLHEKQVGTLSCRSNDSRFAFLPDYIADPDRAVLGLRFEEDLHAEYHAHVRLPPWFSNLLPEGPLRDMIASDRGVKVAREAELLAHVGRDLPGAVRVLPAEGTEPLPDSSRTIVARGPHGEVTEGIWRFSLAGVGLKFSMVSAGERFTAPATGEGGDWIVKLPDATHPQVPLNEFVMMTLASRCGVDVPEVRLVPRDVIESVPEESWPRDEALAFAIRRFDRSGDRALIHIEDFAQVRGFYPDDKYHGSFETLAALIYRDRDAQGLAEFARRMAFNILIGNGDAHLKNWSLIYRDARIPTLAPAYDLVATALYRPPGVKEDLGLKFGRSRRFEDKGLGSFRALEKKLNVEADRIAGEVRTLIDRVQSEWPGVAELFGERDEMREAIGRTIDEGAARLGRH